MTQEVETFESIKNSVHNSKLTEYHLQDRKLKQVYELKAAQNWRVAVLTSSLTHHYCGDITWFFSPNQNSVRCTMRFHRTSLKVFSGSTGLSNITENVPLDDACALAFSEALYRAGYKNDIVDMNGVVRWLVAFGISMSYLLY